MSVQGNNQNTNEDFIQFDQHPWSKDKQFLQVAIRALGGPAGLMQLTETQEGTMFFCRRMFIGRTKNLVIVPEQYRVYTSQQKDYPSIDRLIVNYLHENITELANVKYGGVAPALDEVIDRISSLDPFSSHEIFRTHKKETSVHTENQEEPRPVSIPSWQQAAPIQPLRIRNTNGVDSNPSHLPSSTSSSSDNPSSSAASSSAQTATDAPYPDKFAQIVLAIQSGNELEGIRQIPDTVIRLPNIKPMGQMEAPRKPWEQKKTGKPFANCFVDDDFPDPENE